MRLCEADFGHLDTYNGSSFHTAAVRGVPAAFAEYRRNNPPKYGPGTGPTRMLAGERLVHHLDLTEEEAYRRGDPIRRALVDLGRARSAINVALMKGRDFLGFITLFRQEVRPFTRKQIELVENFTEQAVIAMENARLITETREALEQQTATSGVLRIISSSPGHLEPVFQAVLENAVRICEAKFGALYLCEADAFRAVAMHNTPPAFAEARSRTPLRPPPDALLGIVARTKQVAQVADIKTTKLSCTWSVTHLSPQFGALALRGLTQPVVAYNVPLVSSQAAFRVIEGGAPSA